MATLVICFLFITLMMGLCIVYTSMEYDRFYAQFHQSYTQLAKVVSVQDDLISMYNSMSLFIDDRAAEGATFRLNSYNEARSRANGTLEDLKRELGGRAYYYMSDLQNMLASYDECAKYIRRMSESGVSLVYLKGGMHELSRMKGYVENELSKAQTYLIKQAQVHYLNYESNRSAVQQRLYLLFAVICLLCMALALGIAQTVSKPIKLLVARMARFVSTGEDDRTEKMPRMGAELRSLVGSYDSMIDQLMSKMELEMELAKQQLDNAEMRELLQSSELAMLQMQMNPHFLFNTLNSVSALAQIENAPRTSDMVENLSSMLRYSLSDLDKLVPLHKDLAVVNNYIYIQKTRFGSRIEFIIDAHESSMDCVIPSMIIQPLIENAIVHGLEGKEGMGHIHLDVHTQNGFLQITVRDDGMGMSSERLSEVRQGTPTTGGRRGIGLDNVIRRMKLLYGDGCVSIKSEQGVGTAVNLKIPESAQ